MKKHGSISREWLELIGFSFIVLLPAFMSNFGTGLPAAMEHQELYSRLGFISTLLSSLQFGLVAVFFMSRRGPRKFWGDVASREISWPKQILAGVGLWFAYYLFFDFWGTLAGLLNIHLPSIAWLWPTTGNELLLNGVFAVVNGISEEVMRVYLLEQTQRVGMGRNASALAAAVAMASYHLYQGTFTLIAFLIVHFIFNKLYLSKRPLVTLIVWHALSDFMHSTDILGWQFISEMVNGTFAVGILGLSHLFARLF
ncbi:MAG: CPBP family glutamic-type intramembrane protease [Elusimicrobiota bacterium]